MRLGRKVLVLAGFAVLTAVAVSGGAPVSNAVRNLGRAPRRRRTAKRSFHFGARVRPAESRPAAESMPPPIHDLLAALGPVSPELALVDPELAARARTILAEVPAAELIRRGPAERVNCEWRVVSTPPPEPPKAAPPRTALGPPSEEQIPASVQLLRPALVASPGEPARPVPVALGAPQVP